MRILPITFLTVCTLFWSCGGAETTTTDNSKSEVKYQIDTESVSLKWVAYKTTAKLGVGGEFGKINIGDYALADSPEGAIDEVTFTVPVSSLFTGNTDRDWKLVNLFFGVMDKT